MTAVFLRRLVDRLVVACDPDEILLFGSYAKGLAGRSSDADFLLVLPGPPSVALTHAAFDATRGALPVDTHLHGRAELLAAAADPYGFLGSIVRSGRSVYRRPGTDPIVCPKGNDAGGRTPLDS